RAHRGLGGALLTWISPLFDLRLAAVDLGRLAGRRTTAPELGPGDARHGNAGADDLEPGELLAEREPGDDAGDRRRQVHERRRARDAAHMIHPGPHQPAADR